MENFKFCRVCLLPEDNVMFNSMFADEGIDASNYQKLTNISLAPSDIPALVCSRCSIDLTLAAKLKKTALASNIEVNRMFSTGNLGGFQKNKKNFTPQLPAKQMVISLPNGTVLRKVLSSQTNAKAQSRSSLNLNSAEFSYNSDFAFSPIPNRSNAQGIKSYPGKMCTSTPSFKPVGGALTASNGVVKVHPQSGLNSRIPTENDAGLNGSINKQSPLQKNSQLPLKKRPDSSIIVKKILNTGMKQQATAQVKPKEADKRSLEAAQGDESNYSFDSKKSRKEISDKTSMMYGSDANFLNLSSEVFDASGMSS